MPNALKSPLKWYGGKTKLVNKLLPLVPEHQTFVEVFSGSAALFFAKEISPLEVINDLHSGLVNFYRVLRDPEKFKKFDYLVNLTPFSREEFVFCRDTWQSCRDDVERAYRWFVMMRQSYGAVGKAFGNSVTHGRNGMSPSMRGFLSAVSRLPEIHKRLRSAQIENLDFRSLIEKYDRPQTFFYLDPPYVLSTRKAKAYEHEMSDQDHHELIEILLSIKGKALLSGYTNPLYSPLEHAGWTRHDIKTSCSVASNPISNNRSRIESVWVSPGPENKVQQIPTARAVA